MGRPVHRSWQIGLDFDNFLVHRFFFLWFSIEVTKYLLEFLTGQVSKLVHTNRASGILGMHFDFLERISEDLESQLELLLGLVGLAVNTDEFKEHLIVLVKWVNSKELGAISRLVGLPDGTNGSESCHTCILEH